jgi:hypothetical protein
LKRDLSFRLVPHEAHMHYYAYSCWKVKALRERLCGARHALKRALRTCLPPV